MKRYILYITFLSLICGNHTVYAQGPSTHITSEQGFQEGSTYYKQGSYAAAKQSLQRYLTKNPKSANAEDAYYMLACCSYELQEPGRISLLQKFLRDYPASRYRYRIWALIGSAYYFEGNYKESVKAFEKCKWNYLEDGEVQDMLFRRSLALVENKALDEAEASFRELQKSGPRYATDCTYYLSYLLYQRNELDKSLQGFLSLEKDSRYGRWAACYAGDIYLKKKQYSEALQTANRGLSSSTAENDTWLQELKRIKGEASFHLNDYPEAIASLQSYVRTAANPSREAMYALGVSYLKSDLYSVAAEQLRKVLKQDDALAQNAWLQLGHALLKMNEREQAKNAFAKAAAMQHNAAVREEASYNYALAVYEDPQSDFTQRVNAFERFLADYPQSAYKSKATVYISEIYLSGKNYEAALRSIEKIPSPDNQILQTKQKILFQLGTEALKKNDYSAATQYLTRSLELSSQDAQTAADAYYWRGEAYYRSGKTPLAEKDFRQYLSITRQKEKDTYALAHYNLGYIAFNNKDYSRATTLFTQYLDLQGDGNTKLKADAYNRLGDCYYHARNFTEAQSYYDKASAADLSAADYALYQNAFMAGLQKDYPLKISLLDRMMNSYPQSSYIPSALYEKGRAYIMQDKNNEAIQVYNQLATRYPHTEPARKGALEIGLLHYQADRYAEAINAYKHVIEKYPDTEEARQAMNDLKAVYIGTGRVNEFVAYAAQTGNNQLITPFEQDSLLYESAEQLYLKGDRTRSLKAMEEYVAQFPQGKFTWDARYYLTELYLRAGQQEKALEQYEMVAPHIKDKEKEELLRMSILDAAFAHKKVTLIYQIAQDNTRESGAKAHYLQCELMYAAGEYSQTEQKISTFIDRGSDYGYWMARHFILLCDTFMKLDRRTDAKQYLESLKQNYKGNDDIQERIATRLKALK